MLLNCKKILVLFFLLAAAMLAHSALPPSAYYYYDIDLDTSTGGVWYKPGAIENDDQFDYVVVPFVIDSSEMCYFSAEGTSGSSEGDPAIYLYNNAFNPDDPSSGLLFGGNYFFQENLNAGAQYYLVVTGESDIHYGTFRLSANCDPYDTGEGAYIYPGHFDDVAIQPSVTDVSLVTAQGSGSEATIRWSYPAYQQIAYFEIYLCDDPVCQNIENKIKYNNTRALSVVSADSVQKQVVINGLGNINYIAIVPVDSIGIRNTNNLHPLLVTPVDTQLPEIVTNVHLYLAQNNSLRIVWEPSISNDSDHYLVEIFSQDNQLIRSSGDIDSEESEYSFSEFNEQQFDHARITVYDSSGNQVHEDYFQISLESANDTGLSGDDNSAGPFPIGFPFPFYQQSFSAFYVSTNGMISFNSPNATYGNYSLSSGSNLSGSSLLVFWDDLRTDVSGQPPGKIHYYTLGDAPNRRLVIQWTNQYFFTDQVPMGTFQAVLYESTGEIKYQYRFLNNNAGEKAKGASATIGLYQSTSKYSQIGYNQSVLTSGQSISFMPNGDGTAYVINNQAIYDFIDISGLTSLPPVSPNGRFTNVSAPVWNWSKVFGTNAYQIEISVEGGSPVESQVVGNISSYISTANYAHGVSYVARVRASINGGATWEEWSNYSQPVTIDRVSPTGEISNVAQIGAAAFNIQYQLSDALSGVESGHLQIANDEEFTDLVFEGSVSASGSYELTNVHSQQTLFARVKAKDRAGNESSYSQVIEFSVYQPPTFAVQSLQEKQINVQITPSASSRVLNFYRIYYSLIPISSLDDVSYVARQVQSTSQEVVPVTVPNLMNGRQYYIRVSAIDNNNLEFLALDEKSIRTLMGQVSTLQLVPEKNAIQLSWVYDTPQILNGYDVQFKKVSDTSYELLSVENASDTSLVINGLDSGEQYSVLIAPKGENEAGTVKSATVRTLITNPQLSVSVNEGIVTLGMNTPEERNLVKNYQLYTRTTDYSTVICSGSCTTIANPSPYQSVINKDFETIYSFSASTHYYLAVVSSNLDDRFDRNVTSVHIKTPPSIPRSIAIFSTESSLNASWITSNSVENDIDTYVARLLNAEGNVVEEKIVQKASSMSAEFTGLNPGTSYTVKIFAKDFIGQLSKPLTLAKKTLSLNPDFQLTGLDSQIRVNIVATTPKADVGSYEIYYGLSSFSVLSGSPAYTINVSGSNPHPDSISRTITNLDNGVPYYVAVVAVSKDGSVRNTNFVVKSAMTQQELDPPALDAAQFIVTGLPTQSLTSAPVLTRSGKLSVVASDLSGISKVEFYINNQLLSSQLSANGGTNTTYQADWNLLDVTDGSYVIKIKATDKKNNVNEQEFNVTVALAPPSVPTLATTSPLETNKASITLTGTAQADVVVQIKRNDEPLGAPVVVNSTDKKYSAVVELLDGDNIFTAAAVYNSRGLSSADSSAITINKNSALPAPPANLAALSKSDGQVQLSWGVVSTVSPARPVKGYNIYRSTSPIIDASTVAVLKSITSPSTISHLDIVANDGKYYYRLKAVNDLGTESEYSAQVEAIADKTPPRLVNLIFTSDGQVLNDKYGKGLVTVRAEFSEELDGRPLFNVHPSGGGAIPVQLAVSGSDSLVWTGTFAIQSSTASGTANFGVQAYDKVKNYSTTIEGSPSIVIDTAGPQFTQFAINPVSPIKIDSDTGTIVSIAATLNEPLLNNGAIKIRPIVEGFAADFFSEMELVIDDASSVTPHVTGQFTLPNSVAMENAAVLRFSVQTIDQLGNERIEQNYGNYQVYQNNLPPLGSPSGLTAKATPAANIELSWQSVKDVHEYVLYRSESEWTDGIEITRIQAGQELKYTDDLVAAGLPDGMYYYRISTIRSSNAQTSESAKSAPASAHADRVSPLAPAMNGDAIYDGVGIVLKWNVPVDIDALKYDLYRLNLPASASETEISTAVDAATPLTPNIPQPIAKDTRPDATAHAYVVVAIDAAGNRSAPSDLRYLNLGLIPPTDLKIELPYNGLPKLSWNHSNATALDGFKIYRGAEELTQVAANVKTFTDDQYNSGNVAINGAAVEQWYSVKALDEDSNPKESQESKILLPALTATLQTTEGVAPIARGLMNKLTFRVDNRGSNKVDNVSLVVTLMDGSNTRTHRSENPFSVEANGSALVTVVVGGYQGLTASTIADVNLEYIPAVGQKVTIKQKQDITVVDAALDISIEPQTFTRGGVGPVVFKIKNTSQVEMDVVLATSSGAADSTELRMLLLGENDTVLASKKVKQISGSPMITSTSSGGFVIARIPAGDTFESAPVQLSIPTTAPDSLKVRFVVDAVHYHKSRGDEVRLSSGYQVTAPVSLVNAAYEARNVMLDKTALYEGDTIKISGQVFVPETDQLVLNQPVKLVLSINGFERAYTAYANADGEFEFNYQAQTGELGRYIVSVVHPDILQRPPHGEFVVRGVSVSGLNFNLDIPRNYPAKVNFAVTAGKETAIDNVSLELLPTQSGGTIGLPDGITVQMPSGNFNVASSQSKTYVLTVVGNNNASELSVLRYKVTASIGGDERDLGTLVLNYRLKASAPSLAALPNLLTTGVVQGDYRTEVIAFENKGFDDLLSPTFELMKVNETNQAVPLPVDSWIRMTTAAQLPMIAIGGKHQVNLAIQTPTNLDDGVYQYQLHVTGDNYPKNIYQILVNVSRDGVGTLRFHSADIYTGTGSADSRVPGLQNATIKLQKENILTDVRTLNTNAQGIAEFTVPPGSYIYRATAAGHEAVSGRLWVKPSVTDVVEVFLKNELVTVEWSVNEITLQDRYEVRLDATFQTQVPVAVVKMEPLAINLPIMKKGDVIQGELKITNLGLLQADTVTLTPPITNDYVTVEYLQTPPTVLMPNQVFYLPYRIRALQDFIPATDPLATGAGCGALTLQHKISYVSHCPSADFPASITGGIFARWGSCPSIGSGAIYIGGGGGGGGGGWGGGGGGTSIASGGLVCAAPPQCQSDKCGGADNGGGAH